MKKSVSVVLCVVVLLTVGCAQMFNKADSKGGLFWSTTADYVVVVRSGGVICDVYKLKNVIVQSDTNSDGWIFKDESGNSVLVSGDVMSIRINGSNSALWDKFKEYHDYLESQTYQEKFVQ